MPGEPQLTPPKLRIPATTPAPVPRDRLHALLDDTANPAGPRPVTLVSGPAGSGKTTLLADWVAHSPVHTGWVTVDARDNDPGTLWSGIREALLLTDECSPEEFATVISRADTPMRLILDEAEHLRHENALRDLETLVRQTPGNLRLVLAARTPPRLHLSRLRLEGRLLEIGLPDLSFSRAEATQLFTSHHIELTAGEIDQVLERTDGWPAGLRLLAMSIGNAPERAAELDGFPADNRATADYLNEEVLGGHPAHVRHLLRATSICELVNAGLATALTGQADSGEILDRLDRANALVTRTADPGGWYRYHSVLRAVLLAELDRRQPLVRRNLHQIAAEWFRDNGDPLTALNHAIAADHADLIDELAGDHGLGAILTGHAAEVHALLDTVPAPRPATALVATAAALDLGDLPAADRHLSTVDTPVQPGSLHTLHATLMLGRARLAGQAAEVTITIPDSTGDDDLDVLAHLNQSAALLRQGAPGRAESVVRRVLELAGRTERDHAVLMCLVQLATIAGSRSQLSQMDDRAAQAIVYATRRGWERTLPCLAAYTMRSAYACLRLDLGAARDFVTLARGLLPPHAQPPAALAALALDAIIAFDDDPRSEAAADMVRDRWRRLCTGHVAPPLLACLAPSVLGIALASRQVEWAAEVAHRVETDLGNRAETAFVHAALQAHRGKPGQARKTLAPVLTGDARAVLVTTVIDAWLLEAVLLSRADDHHRAHAAIAKALALAEPQSALRPFRTAGPPVRDLLVKGTGRFGKLDRFVSSALAALPAPKDVPVDQLTSREHDLLLELPSMRTTEEIADSMFVSVNTVKTHLRGIYRKLGVSHRRDAVTVAREWGLL